jgi:hypothetical protein
MSSFPSDLTTIVCVMNGLAQDHQKRVIRNPVDESGEWASYAEFRAALVTGALHEEVHGTGQSNNQQSNKGHQQSNNNRGDRNRDREGRSSRRDNYGRDRKRSRSRSRHSSHRGDKHVRFEGNSSDGGKVIGNFPDQTCESCGHRGHRSAAFAGCPNYASKPMRTDKARDKDSSASRKDKNK